MIIIGLGGNLPSRFGPPALTLRRALEKLEECGAKPVSCSPFYGSHPVPVSDQPDFVNAVALIKTGLPPGALLQQLLSVEQEIGRSRGEANAARTIDLDLLAYGDICLEGQHPDAPGLLLPHPRMHLRGFVLAPLCDIAPEWIHPQLRLSARELFAALPETQGIWRL
jgi:2-amino-4-hydroxy-6-hydroxymethyldihydropteridine diphosphokinase